MTLPEDLLALLRQPSICYLSTLMADGAPHLTQTWVDTDGTDVLINTVAGSRRSRTSSGTRGSPSPSPTAPHPPGISPVRGPSLGLHRWRPGTHRGAVAALPGHRLPLVRRSGPDPATHHHRTAEGHRRPLAQVAAGSTGSVAEGVGVDGGRLAVVEGAEVGELLRGELEVEDVQVLPQPLRVRRLGYGTSPSWRCQRSTTWAGLRPGAWRSRDDRAAPARRALAAQRATRTR